MGQPEQLDQLDIVLSYARHDGEEYAAGLYRDLKAASPRFEPWYDRLLPSNTSFDRVLERKIRSANVLVVVLTRGVPDREWCRREINFADKVGTDIMVAKMHHDVADQITIVNLSPIDFATNPDRGFATLVEQLAAWARAKRVADEIGERIKAAGSEAADPRLESFLHDSRERQREERRRTVDPEEAQRRATKRIKAGLQAEGDLSASVRSEAGMLFVNEMPAVAQTEFKDRIPILKQVDSALCTSAIRLVLLAGESGIGKTALLGEVRKRLADRQSDLRFQARAAAFVYLAVGGYRRVSTTALLHDLAKVIRDDGEQVRLARLLRQALPWREKLNAVLEAIGTTPVVVAIDDADDLLDDAGTVGDEDLHNVVRDLLRRDDHRIRLLVVAGKVPPAFQDRHREHTVICDLVDGLPAQETEPFLRALDTAGVLPAEIPKAVRNRLAVVSDGNPRFLELMYTLLRSDPDPPLESILDDIAPEDDSVPPEVAAAHLLLRVFNCLDRTERRVVQALAVYGRPVRPEAVDFLLEEYVGGVESAPILERLTRRRLLRRDGDRYLLPPKPDAEHILATIAPGDEDEPKGPARYTRPFLFSRAAEYFQEVAAQGPTTARGLDDLQPRFNEIALRIASGDCDRALEVMEEIDEKYLTPWGQSRVLSQWRWKIQPRLRGRAKVHNLSFLVSARDGEEDPDGAVAAALSATMAEPWTRRHPEELLQIRIQRAGVYADDGRLALAAREYRASARRCRLRSMPFEEAMARADLAICLARLGRFGPAETHLRRARRLARTLGGEDHAEVLATALLRYGWMAAQRGDDMGAMALLAEGLDALRQGPGNDALEGRLLDEQASVLCYGDQAELAIPLAERAAEIGVRIRSAALSRQAYVTLALAQLRMGDLAGAASASRAATEQGPGIHALGAWAVHGLVLFRQDDVPAAKAAFHAAGTEAWLRLAREPREYQGNDAAGLALSGLALCREKHRLPAAVAAYDEARRLAPYAGAAHRAAWQLDRFGGRARPDLRARAQQAARGRASPPGHVTP